MQLISLTVKTRRGVAVNQVELIDIDDIAGPIIEANGGADSSFMLREGKKGPFPYSPTNTFVTEYVVDETIAAILLVASNTFAVNILTARGRTVVGSPLMAFSVPFVSGVIKPFNTGSEFLYQEDSDPSLVAYTVAQNPANILAQIQSSGGGGGGINPALDYLDPAISYINTPPVAPALGDRHLINTAPTGIWGPHANEVAEWDGANWTYYTPVADDYIYITDTLLTYRFTGTAWLVFPGTALLQNGNSFGVSGVRMGTNDANPVWIKYNNTLRVRVDGSDIRTPGSLYLGIANMATAPSARLHIVSLTEQVRTAYDASNYFKTTVGATGNVLLAAVGSGSGFALTGTRTYDLLQIGAFSYFAIGGDGNGYMTYCSANAGPGVETGHRFGRYDGSTFQEIARMTSNSQQNQFYMQSILGQTSRVFSIANSNGDTVFSFFGQERQAGINVPLGVDPSAALEVRSVTMGFLPPKMDSIQKNAIVAPASGLIVFDTTLNKICLKGAAGWETVTSI